MAILQHKRGTQAKVADYTPASGEIVVDTTNWRLVIGDGSTVGGQPLTVVGGVSSASADKWTNARTITVAGAVTGTVDLDGSQDVTLTVSQGNIDLGVLS